MTQDISFFGELLFYLTLLFVAHRWSVVLFLRGKGLFLLLILATFIFWLANGGLGLQANKLDCLYISEVMYNPEGSDSLLEYLEICNRCNSSFALDDLFLEGVDFEFPDKEIEAYSAILLPRSCSFQADFYDLNNISPAENNVLCCFSGSLVNSGKNISLWLDSQSGNPIMIDSFDYPVKSGEGYAAVRYANLSSGQLYGGSPGICDGLVLEEEALSNETNNPIINFANSTNSNNSSYSTNSTNLTTSTQPAPSTNTTIINETNQSLELSNSLEDNSTSTNSTDNETLDNVNQTNLTNINQSNSQTEGSLNQTTDSANSSLINDTTDLEINNTETNLSENNSDANSTQDTFENQTETEDDEDETNEEDQATGNENEVECQEDFLYIKAPELVDEGPVEYYIRIFRGNCSDYTLSDFEYIYWVEDFCENILRNERTSSYFGKKSFTPKTDCCAYAIKAKMIEPFEGDLVSKYLIKPEACLKGYEAIEELLGLDLDSSKEKKDALCDEELLETSPVLPLNGSEIIESFYTRKKFFEPGINFYAKLTLDNTEGNPLIFLAERVIKPEDGKNTFEVNLSKRHGYLYLGVVNATHLLDIYRFNYSFELKDDVDSENSDGEASLNDKGGEMRENLLLSNNDSSAFSKLVKAENILLSHDKKPAVQGAAVYVSSNNDEDGKIYKFIIPGLFAIMGGILFYYKRKESPLNIRKRAVMA